LPARVGITPLSIEHGDSSREAAPSKMIVVEPIAVREALASEMIGIPVETLRQHRKRRTGPPFRKDGATVLYLVKELRNWAESLPSPEMAS
jgi:hypothetical protein